MKTNKSFIYILAIFFIISINSIYSFSTYLTKHTYSLVIRQSLFYLIGIIIILILSRIKKENILKYSLPIYIINIVLLILVLLIGTEANGSKAWFNIPIIGTIQPSEFMKIGLILLIAKTISNQELKSAKDELRLITKVIVITIIPSIITFLEPDTGAVIIYFIIAFIMLFASKIRFRWFGIMSVFIATIVSAIFYLYMVKTDTLISLLGTNMFYRFDRIFDWQASSGIQLENSIISIASSGIFGKGINNILLYFPEGHTDFIFTSFSSIYGLVGIFILMITIIWFDILIVKTPTKKAEEQYIIAGICSALFYQQLQNISMTIGLLPITGITLPFISYGGSSLLSYMILLGIIISIQKEKNYKNSFYKFYK